MHYLGFKAHYRYGLISIIILLCLSSFRSPEYSRIDSEEIQDRYKSS